jgi:hypothetical protein
MKKFKCTVTKNYDYEIEIDENVWTDENIKRWASVFEEAETLEDLVAIIAERKTKYNTGEFIEGFGFVKINGKNPFAIEPNAICEHININLEDEYCDVEVEEIEGE